MPCALIPGGRAALASALTLAAACGPAPPPPAGPAALAPRAIFVSFDAMSEDRARATVDPAAIPTLIRFLDRASCADGARPMFPSLTAASHAALWTGAYGNVNGISANTISPLPWGEFTITETQSGFLSRQLTAEPIWITAARAGVPTVAYHTTQASEPAGRWLGPGGRDGPMVRRDSAAWTAPHLFAVNGYNEERPATFLTAERNPPRPAVGWRNLAQLGQAGTQVREVAWAVGSDSVFALFFGAGGYQEVAVNTSRDVAGAVRVRPAPLERDPVGSRALARHFSGVLWLGRGAARAGLYFRLWSLAPDLSSYELLQIGAYIPATNHASQRRELEDSTGGFIGNGESGLLRDGALGLTLRRGGDGTAELKYLETAELATRQFIRGSEWLWRRQSPRLQVEYFPIVDEVDHLWYGLVSPEVPTYNAGLAARIADLRARGWAMADRRLAALLALAQPAGALLVLSGDHGMRPTWRAFNVNVALRNAGLLVTDPRGRPDLTRTRAYSPNGNFVLVNRVRRKGGIVSDAGVAAVADSAAAALLSARDASGRPVVTRVWRPAPEDSLGIGGPAGGELYFGLAPGTYVSTRLGDSVVTGFAEPTGSHGFPSVDPDMRTVLCALGPGVGGLRLPTARVIDAAPTVSEWLGIPAPANARGRSLLAPMRAR